MPHKVMPSAGLPSVDAYSDAIKRWLDKAESIKQQPNIEPALIAADFLKEVEEIGKIRHESGVSTQQAHYAAIETALRDKFYELLVRGYLPVTPDVLTIYSGFHVHRTSFLQRDMESS